MKKHLLFIFAALLPLVASAQTKVEIDGIWYNLSPKKVKQAEVTYKGLYSDSYDEYSGSITIPATVTYEGVEYSVTSIGGYAFSDCRSLTAITIPESVTSIGDYAFLYCYSLTAITIPEGVTSIGNYAFRDCSSLTAITIPESVTSIGNDAFYNCRSLMTVINYSGLPLESGSRHYGYVAYYADRVINLNEFIGDYAFQTKEGVHYLTGYIGDDTEPTLPTDYKGENYQIGDYAFENCSSLTSITIPESVTSIGERAFRECSSLTAVTLPEGVTSIGSSAFDGCSSLTAITIPEGVTSIGDLTFSHCGSLTAITIPENSQLTSIGDNAFWNCSSLTAITIPEGVKSIGNYAFDNCSALKKVIIEDGSTTLSLGYNEYHSSVSGQGLFYNCPLEEVYLGRNLSYSSDRLYGYSPFYNKTTLATLTIGDKVTSIGEYAFGGCSSLTAITLPESVTSIGVWAFADCRSLATVVLPKSVESIGSEAFANCAELTDVYCYAKSVPSTYTDAFDGSYIEYATLHVLTSALNAYKTTAPWSGFGKFETTSIAVTNITLNASSATITEGETMTLTAIVAPNDADDPSITWSSSDPSVATVDNAGTVTAIAPGTAIITATANGGSGVSAQCEVTVKELILGTCATPTISYKDGKVIFDCDTEGAIVKSNFKENFSGEYNDMEVDIIPTYTITAYATKEKYENSDTVSLTLCWVPCDEKHEEEDGIITIPSHPVLIQCQGGVITLSGLAEGTEVAVFTTAGTEVANTTASDGTATLTTDLSAGSTVLVKIGGHSVKVVIK